jgi:GNAT superfamily N-acetyltransferase
MDGAMRSVDMAVDYTSAGQAAREGTRREAGTSLKGAGTLIAPTMITRPLGKQDYHHIVQVIDRWWGGPTSALAHPLFFYELGSLARVVEHDGILVGFLFGFIAPGPPKTGYVHLVGIHPDYRRQGVGKVLYQTFEEDCRSAGCTRLKAVTTIANEGSIAFHKATGWNVARVEDYAGPARPRIVFDKAL